MRLAAFIRANIESISVEWERFAATLLPEQEFSSSVLRDSIADLLAEIATDMDEDQTAEEQHQKSEGHPDRSNFTRGAVVQARAGAGRDGIIYSAVHLGIQGASRDSHPIMAARLLRA
jgi:hypothetical protein